ncbi:MAG: hypothetical protein ACRD47_15045 [Nitrososphaeraceae archaeon]
MSELLELLKDLSKTEGDRRTILDSKAQHIITISGTVVTLLFAFIAFLIGYNVPNNGNYSVELGHLVLAIVMALSLGVVTMLFGILTLRVVAWPLGDIDGLLKTKNQATIKKAIKDTFKNNDATSFETLIDDDKLSKGLNDDDTNRLGVAKVYISFILLSRGVNHTKARNLTVATWLIFSCIVSIGLITFFVWSYLPVLIRNA